MALPSASALAGVAPAGFSAHLCARSSMTARWSRRVLRHHCSWGEWPQEHLAGGRNTGITDLEVSEGEGE
jgi:hypothetical protein